MAFEGKPQNSYESLKRASDGNLVKESELNVYEKELQSKEDPEDADASERPEQELKRKGISRRTSTCYSPSS